MEVDSTLIDPAGKAMAAGSARITVDPFDQSVVKFALPVESPKLWSVDQPVLYSVRTVVKRNGAILDEVTTRCGFRTIRFDPDKGFFLNDQPLKLLAPPTIRTTPAWAWPCPIRFGISASAGSRKWDPTPTAAPTTRPPPSFWMPATAWACW